MPSFRTPYAPDPFRRVRRKPGSGGQTLEGQQSVAEAVRGALKQRRTRGQDRLLKLWSHWDMVMGADLAALAKPLGHRRDVLLVGGEDSLALQDLRFQSEEILERANAFMESPFFRKVELSLISKRRQLNDIPVLHLPPKNVYIPPRPAKLGSLRGAIDPTSPVGRAYEAYVQMYERLRRNKG